MENKKRFELNDGALDAVSGGAFGDWETCPVYGVVTCFRCRSPLTRETGCAHCGTTWDEYLQITETLRGE